MNLLEKLILGAALVPSFFFAGCPATTYHAQGRYNSAQVLQKDHFLEAKEVAMEVISYIERIGIRSRSGSCVEYKWNFRVNGKIISAEATLCPQRETLTLFSPTYRGGSKGFFAEFSLDPWGKMATSAQPHLGKKHAENIDFLRIFVIID